MKIILNKATSHILFVIAIQIMDVFKNCLDGKYGYAIWDLLLAGIWVLNYAIIYQSIQRMGLEKYITNGVMFLKSICLLVIFMNIMTHVSGTLSFLCPVIMFMAVVTIYEMVTILFAKQIEQLKRWLTK